MMLLGVTLTCNLHMTEHVSKKILSGIKSLIAMKTLKAHGMPVKKIHECY